MAHLPPLLDRALQGIRLGFIELDPPTRRVGITIQIMAGGGVGEVRLLLLTNVARVTAFADRSDVMSVGTGEATDLDRLRRAVGQLRWQRPARPILFDDAARRAEPPRRFASFDERWHPRRGGSHALSLGTFVEPSGTRIDLMVTFDALTVFANASGRQREIPLARFAHAGVQRRYARDRAIDAAVATWMASATSEVAATSGDLARALDRTWLHLDALWHETVDAIAAGGSPNTIAIQQPPDDVVGPVSSACDADFDLMLWCIREWEVWRSSDPSSADGASRFASLLSHVAADRFGRIGPSDLEGGWDDPIVEIGTRSRQSALGPVSDTAI